MNRTSAVVALAVFLPALAIRLHPVVSESFQYDAIVTQLAGREGVAANAVDGDDTFSLRRYHPPLVAYLVAVNNAVAGDGPFAARLFSIVFGALACMATALGVLVACGRRPPPDPLVASRPSRRAIRTTAAVGAIAGGLTLAFLPVHLYISRTANWDAVYSFFAVSTLALLALRLVTSSRRALAAAAVAFALALATCELALALVPAALAAFLFDLRRRGRRVLGQWLVAVAVVAVVTTVVWPAGVFSLDLARTLRFRYYNSAFSTRNLPWVDFYTTAFSQSPFYCVAVVLAVAWLYLVAGVRAMRSAVTSRRVAPALGALVPFAVYAATVVGFSTRERLVYVHHIADLFPALSVLMGAALALTLREARPRARALILVAAVVLLVGSIAPGLGNDPKVVGPQEHPGFLGAGEYFDRHPGARVYCHYTTPLTFYAKDIEVVGPREKEWTDAALMQAKEGTYDYVVSDRTMLGPRVPDIESLARALAPQYELVHTVFHRRTGKPVLWIYGRRNTP